MRINGRLGKAASIDRLTPDTEVLMSISSLSSLPRQVKSPVYQGDLRIYSAPLALLRHIQWSLNEIFGEVAAIEWVNQPLVGGASAMSLEWRASKPHASKIASTLKSWHFIRFEVREYSVNGGEGVLYRCTPDLGLHQAVTSSTGDVMIHENRLHTLTDNCESYESLRDAIALALGTRWDAELECYRLALEDGAPALRVSM